MVLCPDLNPLNPWNSYDLTWKPHRNANIVAIRRIWYVLCVFIQIPPIIICILRSFRFLHKYSI